MTIFYVCFEFRVLSIHVSEVIEHLEMLGHRIVLFIPSSCRFLNERFHQRTLVVRIPEVLPGSAGELIYSFLVCLQLLLGIHQQPDIIYVRHSFLAFPLALFCRMMGWPYVNEVNGISEIEMSEIQRASLWKLGVVSWLNRSVYRLSERLIVVSPELRHWLMKVCNIPSCRIHFVSNGADERLFSPMDMCSARVRLGWRKDFCYVGYIGSMAPWQGLEILIQSASYVLEEMENVYFVIGGDGLLRGWLEKMVRQRGLEDIFFFLGTIPYTQVPLYIGGCDVVVAPFLGSRRNITGGFSSLKIYAYMSCARPVVTTDICGLDKLIGKSGAGIVVEPDDPRRFAMAIVSLLRNDELRNRMGIRGRALVLRDFTWRRSAERIVDVLEGILKQ